MNTHQQTVTVRLSDLSQLADLISGMDYRTVAPSLSEITACHNLIAHMAGPYAKQLYLAEQEAA